MTKVDPLGLTASKSRTRGGTVFVVPELPDVEGYRRFFSRYAAGKTVAGVSADPTILRNASAQGLGRALRGHRFEEPWRHGKWLICDTDGPSLLFHYGMTGLFVWS